MSIREAVLVTSGDLRQAANRICRPAQAELESTLFRSFAGHGCTLRRASPYSAQRGHWFLESQREGMDVFRGIDPQAPLVVAIAAWQYTHHVLPGLRSHRDPILTVAN